jgi:hypothetical protein
MSGTASSEGGLSRSGNGSYVILGGYAAAPGTAGVAATTSMAVNRVVGRVDAAGSVDTSTRLSSAFSTNNIRSATSSDGTGFWAAGNGTSSSGGVHFVALGSTGAGTQLSSAPTNVRVAHVFADQLYASSGSGAFVNVFAVGTGLPTTAGQTSVSLPGMPTSGASPFSFVLLDRNPAVTGVDTLYVADDGSVATSGGLQKWTFNGTSWTLVTTYTSAGPLRGLAGLLTGPNVTLFASTTESLNRVVRFVDDGSANPAAQVLATAAMNTAFRGVSLSPQ